MVEWVNTGLAEVIVDAGKKATLHQATGGEGASYRDDRPGRLQAANFLADRALESS